MSEFIKPIIDCNILTDINLAEEYPASARPGHCPDDDQTKVSWCVCSSDCKPGTVSPCR